MLFASPNSLERESRTRNHERESRKVRFDTYLNYLHTYIGEYISYRRNKVPYGWLQATQTK